jgi:hypothetical protein
MEEGIYAVQAELINDANDTVQTFSAYFDRYSGKQN